MRIIELCGKAGVGKDTFGGVLKTHLEERGYKCIHVAFADRLKDICKNYFNWDGSKNEEGRRLLQRLGTDVFRAYKQDFWIEEVRNLLDVLNHYHLFDIAIITDTRFPNEIENLKMDGLEVMPFRIKRKNFTSRLTDEAQHHASETALDDVELNEILLSGDINKLGEEVDKFIEEWIISDK